MNKPDQPIKSPLTKKRIKALIPEAWNDAGIYISNSIGKAEPITRVSFHENLETGNRIIMFHEEELKP